VREVLRCGSVAAEVIRVDRTEERVVDARRWSSSRAAPARPPASSWKFSASMWQSEQARPLPVPARERAVVEVGLCLDRNGVSTGVFAAVMHSSAAASSAAPPHDESARLANKSAPRAAIAEWFRESRFMGAPRRQRLIHQDAMWGAKMPPGG
jgi:hypothetical protein